MIIDFLEAKEKKESNNLSENDKLLIKNIKMIGISCNDRLLESNKKWRRDVIFVSAIAFYLEIILLIIIIRDHQDMGEILIRAFIGLMIFICFSPLIVFIFKKFEYKKLMKERQRFI